MTPVQDLPERPLPFGGDRERWARAVSASLAAHAAEHVRRGQDDVQVVGLLPVERTGWGWIRWGWPPEDEVYFEETVPREVGVFAPGRPPHTWVARAVWGRQPLPRVESVGDRLLPFPVSVGRCAVVVATVLTLGRLLPGWGLFAAIGLGVALAWGLPALLAVATLRQVRVVRAQDAAAIFKMLAAHQVISQAAAMSDEEELRRAVALGHRVLWDSAGLLRASDVGGAELNILDSYADAYERLVEAAVAVVNDRSALDEAIVGPSLDDDPDGSVDHAFRGVRRTRMVEQAVPAELLHAAARDLEELGAGLRHARSVVAGTVSDATSGGDGHAERS